MISGKELIQVRESPKFTIKLLLFLLLAYLLDTAVFGPRVHGFLGNYILPVITWGLVVIFIIKLPAAKPSGKLRHRRLLLWLAFISVIITIVVNMLGGMVSQFGRSPYDHSLIGIIINIFLLGTNLIAMEMSRAWLMNRHFSRLYFTGITLLSLSYTISAFTLNQIVNLKGGLAIAKFIGMNFLPQLGQNVLATCLVFLGGPVPAITYRGGLLAFERLSPVLPNSSWALQTLLGTFAPIICLILMQSIYQEENKEVKVSRQKDSLMSWLFTSLAAIIIIWFSLGVFSYSPRVILSGSMQPGINIGDIVIIKKMDGNQAKVGDIIMFPMGNMKITHRIIAVKELNGKKYFTTKGDANGEPEQDPVSEKNVKGKVVMVIPKAGKLTIFLRGGG